MNDIESRAAELGLTLEAYGQRLIDSFWFFVQEVWHDRELQSKAPLGWVEQEICEWVEQGPTHSGVLAPRGHGKTHLVAASLTLHDLLRDPDRKILIVSKSEGHAKKTISLLREWIDHVPFLQHLRPKQKKGKNVRGQRDSAKQFDVGPARPSRDPSVTASGIEGQITGSRAHRVIPDDVETPENTQTREARDLLDATVREFSNVASFGKREITYLGTYHHEDSLYIKLVDRGYHFRTWPMLAPHADDKIVGLAPGVQRRIDSGELRPGSRKDAFDGSIIAPYRYDPDEVAEKIAEGRTHFAMQFQLIADLGDSLRYPLQLRDLIVHPVQRDQAPITIAWGTRNDRGGSTRIEDIPASTIGNDALYAPIMFDDKWADYTGTKMFIDPSGKGADKTGQATVSHLHGFLHVKAVEGYDGGYDATVLNRICRRARELGVNEILVEEVALQGMFVELLRPVLQRHFLEPGQDEHHPEGWKCSLELVKLPKIQKEVRIIDALEPILNQHRLVVDPSVAGNQALQYQLTRITRQRGCLPHEDELDALASCVQSWRDILSLDANEAAEQQRQQWIDEELERFRQLAGHPSQPPRWFQHR